MEALRGQCLIRGWVILPDMSTISLELLTHGVVGRASSGTLVFTVYSLFSPAHLLAAGVSVCRSHEVFMVLPPQPSHWDALPCARGNGLARIGGPGGVLPSDVACGK